MNPDDAGEPAGIQHRVPGLPALQPRQRHSVRRAAEAAAVLSGSDLDSRQARPPLRRIVRAHRRRPDLRRLRQRGRGPQHDLGGTARARQLRARPAARASRPRSIPQGYPGGTYIDAGEPAELHERQQLQRVRALCQRQLEPGQPPHGEPRRCATSTTARRRRATRSSTRTSTTAIRTCRSTPARRPTSSAASPPALRCRPTRARSARCGSRTGTTGRRASDSPGT